MSAAGDIANQCLRCERGGAGEDLLCQACSWRTLRALPLQVDLVALGGPIFAICHDGVLIGLGLSGERPAGSSAEDSLVVSLSTWAAVQGIRRLRAAPPSP